MKKVKIFIIFSLLILVSIEIYFFFFGEKVEKEKSNQSSFIVENNINEEDKKYIVDIFTSYKKNSLDFIEVNDNNITYHKISGLKNKELEDKINIEIKNKVYAFKDKIKNSTKYKFYSEIEGSFENVLSIKIVAEGDFNTKSLENTYHYGYNKRIYCILNYDLNTGNQLNIFDIVLSKSSLRTEIVDKATEHINKNIGFVCDGGPCENPEPDYSKVEDGVLSIINRYNKDDYIFSFSESGIELYFKNVYVPNPEEVYEEDDGYDKCKVYNDKYDDFEEKRYICQDNYEDWFETTVDFYKIYDNLIVYDKFKSTENIFLKEQEVVNRKFVKTNTGNDDFVYDILEESDNQLIDYDLNYGFCFSKNDVVLKLEDLVIKEVSELKKDKFNIYNINGNIVPINDEKYYYVYFDVTHYNLDKDKYLENKKNIYLNKFEKYEFGEMSNIVNYVKEYDYLKDYLTKKSYYFYIIDKNGKEYNTRDILNKDFDFKTYIPEEWMSLGKYKTIESLVDNAFLVYSDEVEFLDRLVILDDEYMNLKFKYKGKTIEVGKDYFEKANIRKRLYK